MRQQSRWYSSFPVTRGASSLSDFLVPGRFAFSWTGPWRTVYSSLENEDPGTCSGFLGNNAPVATRLAGWLAGKRTAQRLIHHPLPSRQADWPIVTLTSTRFGVCDLYSLVSPTSPRALSYFWVFPRKDRGLRDSTDIVSRMASRNHHCCFAFPIPRGMV